MARTITEIEQSITDQVASEATLSGINTASATGFFTSIKKVFARAMQTLEELWDVYSLELDARAAEAVPGTARWYNDRAKEFQYGDVLTVIDGKVVYPVIDTTKQIVKYAAISEADGVVLIKVAKDSSGAYVKLVSSTELVAFRAYINSIKFAGTKTQVVSTDPDLVRVKITVYYNAQLVGSLAAVKTAVETAINDHLKGIYFDGVFNINKLRDAIEVLPEVVSGGVTIQFVNIKPDGGTYSAVTYTYNPYSGYYKIDPTYPLSSSDQITYVAQ